VVHTLACPINLCRYKAPCTHSKGPLGILYGQWGTMQSCRQPAVFHQWDSQHRPASAPRHPASRTWCNVCACYAGVVCQQACPASSAVQVHVLLYRLKHSATCCMQCAPRSGSLLAHTMPVVLLLIVGDTSQVPSLDLPQASHTGAGKSAHG